MIGHGEAYADRTVASSPGHRGRRGAGQLDGVGCNHTVVSVGAAVEPAGLPIRFAIMFAIQPDGGLEVGGSVGLVTELGVFSLEASVRTEMTSAANETLLIIRHYLRGQVVDSVFKIGTAEAVTVTAIGTIKIEVASQCASIINTLS